MKRVLLLLLLVAHCSLQAMAPVDSCADCVSALEGIQGTSDRGVRLPCYAKHGFCVRKVPLQVVLFDAVVRGDVEVIAQLYVLVDAMRRRRVDFNVCNAQGHTALCVAVKSDRKNVVEALLMCGACVNVANSVDGNTPLHVAVLYERCKIIEMLLEANADCKICNFEGLTPSHYAKEKKLCSYVKPQLAVRDDRAGVVMVVRDDHAGEAKEE